MKDFEAKLAEFFAKFPHLPASAREFIVKISPWLAVIFLIILLPIILAALAISTAFLPFGAYVGSNSILFLLIAIAGVILWGLSIPGLFKRHKSGWEYSMYGVLLGFVRDILHTDIIGAIIGALIGLYILFEVKEYYH
jgi:hypothetical protein